MSAAYAIHHISLPELFNPESHRLDASRIANALSIPVGTVAAAIGRKPEGVRKRPDAESLQVELGRLYRIWTGIVELYGGNHANASIFLNAPNPNLENKTPLAFIKFGQLDALESLITAMDMRQPS
jgi:uncharacterized protein (DUF2384 family)